jgi:TPR repeat protein
MFGETLLEAFKNKCDNNNDGGSCLKVARIYYGGGNGIEIDIEKSMRYYDRACDLEVLTCDYVAKLYYYGRNGLEKNMSKAIKYYKRHCDSNLEDYAPCQFVAYAYEIGDGVKKNMGLAHKYYTKVCDFSYYVTDLCDRAQTIKAMVNTKESNPIKALEKSCETQNDSLSCYKIAEIYDTGGYAFTHNYLYGYRETKLREVSRGERAPIDPKKAFKYYAKACELEQVEATCSYAKTLEEKIKSISATQ